MFRPESCALQNRNAETVIDYIASDAFGGRRDMSISTLLQAMDAEDVASIPGLGTGAATLLAAAVIAGKQRLSSGRTLIDSGGCELNAVERRDTILSWLQVCPCATSVVPGPCVCPCVSVCCGVRLC